MGLSLLLGISLFSNRPCMLHREGMYQSVKEQVLGTMLQKKDYQDQIDEQMEQVIASRQESSSSSS